MKENVTRRKLSLAKYMLAALAVICSLAVFKVLPRLQATERSASLKLRRKRDVR